MDTHRNSLHAHHAKSVEELKQTLFYTAMELETTRAAAQEELKRREDQLLILNQLLNRAIKERDEALHKSRQLHFENHLLLVLQRYLQPPPIPAVAATAVAAGGDPLSGVSSVEDEQAPVRGTDQLSPDCEESIVSPVAEEEAAAAARLVPRKPLPEKGKLLQAVMKAGPLLQTLLLAGPLPQWRHPPPPLESFEIPPVGIAGCESGGSSGSGVAADGLSPTRPYKYQRLAS